MKRFAAAFVMAATLASVIVVGADHGRAYAFVPPPPPPVIIPVAAGTAVVAGVAVVADGLGLCGGAGFDCTSTVAEVAYDVLTSPLRLFGWGSREPERSVTILPSPSTTYIQGCWARVPSDPPATTGYWDDDADTSWPSSGHGGCPNDGTTTYEAEEGCTDTGGCWDGGRADGISWTSWESIGWTFTIEQACARGSVCDVKVRGTWSGYVPAGGASGGTARQAIRLGCGGYEGYDQYSHQWDMGTAAHETGLSTGSVTHTFPASLCVGAGGISSLGMYDQGAGLQVRAKYRFKGTPEPIEEVPAPLHKFRTVKVCAGTGGETATVTGYSRAFYEADENLPNFPNPACPEGTLAQSMTVYEGDENGAGGTAVLTWTAPTTTEQAELVEYSDCLPGGTAYPCVVRLLKVTPNGLLECSDPNVDCRQFDPATSTETQYQCRWGTHVVPLSQCQVALTHEVVQQTGTEVGTDTPVDQETRVDEDSRTSPDTGDDTFLECIGKVSLNPVSWVLNPVKCALKWAFVPKTTTVTDVWAQVETEVPFVVVTEAVGGAQALWTGTQDALDMGACWDVDLRGMTPDAFDGGGVESLNVHMPAPTSAGCASSIAQVDGENNTGDLWGFRTPIRLALLVLLMFAAIRKTIGAFAVNGDPQALDVTP